jgi:H+/Cl- antiporter ClcA
MALDLLLHAVQHVAFGYDLSRTATPESFLQGVTGAAPERRLAALIACGLVAGFGWAFVRRYGAPLVSVRAAVGRSRTGPAMPVATTLAHALLQMITVGLGSPLGREVAPREIATMLAGQIGRGLGLAEDEMRLVLACGAGGGLAAVYNVPAAGALFALEVLLGRFSIKAAGCAIVTSAVAAIIASLGLGHQLQYRLPPFSISGSLTSWALLSGPLFGLAGVLFSRLTAASALRTPACWKRIPWCIIVFTAIGATACLFPQLPGNGRGPIQLAFDGALGLNLAAALLLLKLAAVAACLRVGAGGGLLTPGMTIGALLALPLGAAWSLAFPGPPPGAYAFVGAAAFLAASMAMPLTAIVLVMEFTRADFGTLVPLALAVLGAVASQRLYGRVKAEARRRRNVKANTSVKCRVVKPWYYSNMGVRT